MDQRAPTLEELKMNPREGFQRALKQHDLESLLIKAAEIHGHFCPGIALGVLAAANGLVKMGLESKCVDGVMEDLLAIVEINACFADGIQAVSGCTFGNNGLIFRDIGHTAVTFVSRGSKTGLRIRVKPEFKALVEKSAPRFYPLMEKVIVQRKGSDQELKDFKAEGRKAAFGLIKEDCNKIFAFETVEPRLPDHAPISPLVICPKCGEPVLEVKTKNGPDGSKMCLTCAGEKFRQVDGRGIVKQRTAFLNNYLKS